jgi:hypothetical protein
MVLLADPSLFEHAVKIAELAQSARLPTAFQFRESVAAGAVRVLHRFHPLLRNLDGHLDVCRLNGRAVIKVVR